MAETMYTLCWALAFHYSHPLGSASIRNHRSRLSEAGLSKKSKHEYIMSELVFYRRSRTQLTL